MARQTARGLAATSAGTVTTDATGQSAPAFVLGAVPRKRVLRDAANKLNPDEALGELIDNAIDNFEKQQLLGYDEPKLRVEIELREGDEETPPEIIVVENSGGVHPDDLLSFVQLGGESPVRQALEAASIGVWGAGQKQALGKLGYDQMIITRYWDARHQYRLGSDATSQYADEIMIRTDRDWWFRDDWDVPIYLTEEPIPAGTTRYIIRSLNVPVNADEIDDLYAELANVYGDLLHTRDGEIEILINGKSLDGPAHLTEDAMKRVFAFRPGLEPAKHIHDVSFDTWDPAQQLEIHHPLRMEIIVGLTPRSDKEHAGVYMFGTPESPRGRKLGPRMFAHGLQDESVGYVPPGTKLPPGSPPMRKNDPLLGRLRVYVNFYGASGDIPWGTPGSPVKKGFNASHPAAPDIRRAITDAAAPFAWVAPPSREIDMVPFSAEWMEYDEGRKFTVVRRGAQIVPEDFQLEEVQEKIQPLVELTFDSTTAPIHIWDHTQSERPPKVVASFDRTLARQIRGNIIRRDKALDTLKKDAPGLAVQEVLDSLPLGAPRPEPAAEPTEPDISAAAYVDPEASQVVSIRLKTRVLQELMYRTGKRKKGEAVLAALDAFLEPQEHNADQAAQLAQT